jgi:uncharacterized repeat protein (TIGR02543 family)
MDVNSIGINIANSSDVYWVVTKGDSSVSCSDGLSGSNVLGSGTFFGKIAGETIKLATDIEVTTTEQKYTVWIWINSEGTGLGKLSGETVDTNVWTQIDMVDPDADNDVENDEDVYMIMYNVNGGINGPANQEKTAGQSVILSNTQPTRNGYTFNGWNTIPNGTGTSYTGGSTYNTDADLILYAVWLPNTYTINYNLNGGTGGSTAATSCSYEKSCVLSNNGFTKTGYTFIGWSDSGTGTEIVYKDGDKIRSYDKTSDMTLYALWKINTYMVSYECNFGTGCPDDQIKIHGVDLQLSTVKPTRDDHDFVGWNTKADGSGTSYQPPDDDYKIDANVTLYPQWRFIAGHNKVTIYYNVNGGTVTPNATYNWSSDANGRILGNGYAVKNEVEIGSTVNLNNVSVGSLMEVLKTNETATDGAEWICLSGCTTANKTFNQNTLYSALDFCDVEAASCEVELGVNWKPNQVIVSYSVNGGTMLPYTVYQGRTVSWTVDNDGLIYCDGELCVNKINLGNTLGTSGLYNYNNSSLMMITNPGKIGKSGEEWICLSGCTTVNDTFEQQTLYSSSDFCDASNGDCTVVLGVNWVDKATPTLTVSPTNLDIVLAASGSGTITYTYNGDGTVTCSSSNTSIATCSVNTSTKTVTVTAKAKGSTTVTLNASEGATYKSVSKTVSVDVSLATYTVSYDACGGSGAPGNQIKTFGETLKLSTTTPTRSGYTFKGWATSASGRCSSTSAIISAWGDYTANASIVFYAVWELASFASYISDQLYTAGSATTVVNNSKTYYRDTTDLLLNDGFGSGGTKVASSGNIRYYGNNPNNYVYFNCDIYPSTNCEIWRIVGVFTVDGKRKVKIMRESSIGSLTYDNKKGGLGTAVSGNVGSNAWIDSRLMMMLNPSEYSSSIGSSIYAYTKGLYYNSSTSSCYNGTGNNSTSSTACNFTSTGIKNYVTRNMISESTWNIGRGEDSNSLYADQYYAYERGTITPGNSASTWIGKIGLIYASDYGYAVDLSKCTYDLRNYSKSTGCYSNTNWMENIFDDNTNPSYYSITISGRGNNYLAAVSSNGGYGHVLDLGANYNGHIHPTVYLDEDVINIGGNGSIDNPYLLNLFGSSSTTSSVTIVGQAHMTQSLTFSEWSVGSSGLKYTGYGNSNHWIYGLQVTMPTFTGTATNILFNINFKKNSVASADLNWALVRNLDNITSYRFTKNAVTDSNQIASGVIELKNLISSGSVYHIDIDTTELQSNQTYYLLIWAKTDGIVDVNPTVNHSVYVTTTT